MPSALLLDWNGTIFGGPSRMEVLRAGARDTGRDLSERELQELVDCRQAAAGLPHVAAAMAIMDISAEAHRTAALLRSAEAGLPADLAEAAYAHQITPSSHRPYPGVPAFLRALSERRVPVAVVSNIGWDIRRSFAHHGLLDLVDGFVLSYELGVLKPEPAIFLAACSGLGVAPEEALMVGDDAAADGGAAAVGIPTLILPRAADGADRGIDIVLRVLDAEVGGQRTG